ncbi:hypothetical protein ACVIWV_008919 [Bradyrhizobium diazoefficiens]
MTLQQVAAGVGSIDVAMPRQGRGTRPYVPPCATGRRRPCSAPTRTDLAGCQLVSEDEVSTFSRKVGSPSSRVSPFDRIDNRPRRQSRIFISRRAERALRPFLGGGVVQRILLAGGADVPLAAPARLVGDKLHRLAIYLQPRLSAPRGRRPAVHARRPSGVVRARTRRVSRLPGHCGPPSAVHPSCAYTASAALGSGIQ